MLTRFRDLIFSPILVALALGGFSVYLVTEGEVEAAMGGTGAAIAAATMKRSEDSEEDYEIEIRIRNQLRIQALEIEAQNRKYLEEQKHENIYLRCQLEIKEKEALLSLREKELEHKIEMLLKEQEFADPKILPEPKEAESRDSKDNSS